MHWDKGKLEQPDGAAQAGFKLLSMITDQYQQNEQSEHLIRWKEESCCSASKRHTEKTVRRVN